MSTFSDGHDGGCLYEFRPCVSDNRLHVGCLLRPGYLLCRFVISDEYDPGLINAIMTCRVLISRSSSLLQTAPPSSASMEYASLHFLLLEFPPERCRKG
jgi:hypothetical protein